jgi:hypothetical protein
LTRQEGERDAAPLREAFQVAELPGFPRRLTALPLWSRHRSLRFLVDGRPYIAQGGNGDTHALLCRQNFV